MTRVAVLGANGQVGAELCLLLAADPGIDLIAICRNRSGSAFLRWQGIACRHGRVADPRDAPRLLGDADVIVNSSLAAGSPAEIRHAEDQIVKNTVAHSKRSAVVIHFSTQSVYGDPRSGQAFRRINPYGKAKLATERTLHSASRSIGRRAYILRLGHVCGPLQEITHTIRSEILNGSVVLPAIDYSSNTVYTAAIVAAIIQIARSNVAPATYDLMNSPRWTWREVYDYEAGVVGAALRPTIAASHESKDGPSPARAAAQAAASLAANQTLRESFSKLFAHVPATLNARAMAWWYQRRARAEIGRLHGSSAAAAEHLSWVENGWDFFPADVPTRQLLDQAQQLIAAAPRRGQWAEDLPDAIPTAI